MACHAKVVALYQAFTSLSSRRHELRIHLDRGQMGCALAEEQLGFATSLCGQLMGASLTAIVTGDFLNADSKGFQLEMSC